MKVEKVILSNADKITMNKIINTSKKPMPVGKQVVIANYYAYLQKQQTSNTENFAKTLLGK